MTGANVSIGNTNRLRFSMKPQNHLVASVSNPKPLRLDVEERFVPYDSLMAASRFHRMVHRILPQNLT